jgi:hypothetical protein
MASITKRHLWRLGCFTICSEAQTIVLPHMNEKASEEEKVIVGLIKLYMGE